MMGVTEELRMTRWKAKTAPLMLLCMARPDELFTREVLHASLAG
jgi:hypothetical protein